MDAKNRQLLEKARDCVHSWKMVEAYNILRRFYDRLPFAPEKEHAEYIGLFVRVLFELGKDYELNFYMKELERMYRKNPIPDLAYPLGVLYSNAGREKQEAAREIFERIVRDSAAKAHHPKAKMLLAAYYQEKEDYLAYRMLIESIDPAACDQQMVFLVEVCKAVAARGQKRFDEGHAILRKLLQRLTLEVDWYAYFTARLQVAMLFIDQKDWENATSSIREVRAMFDGARFKTVESHIKAMESLLKEKSDLGVIRLVQGDGETSFSYDDMTLPLTGSSHSDRLLLLLLKKRFLDKSTIVMTLYRRQYNGKPDDKLIYYHMHEVRGRLMVAGLPAEAVISDRDGYRLVPQVENVKR